MKELETLHTGKPALSTNGGGYFIRPIYRVRFLLTIVACDFWDFCSGRCSRHGKIVYDFHDIKLPVATIVVGFQNMFQKPTTFFVSYATIVSKL